MRLCFGYMSALSRPENNGTWTPGHSLNTVSNYAIVLKKKRKKKRMNFNMNVVKKQFNGAKLKPSIFILQRSSLMWQHLETDTFYCRRTEKHWCCPTLNDPRMKIFNRFYLYDLLTIKSPTLMDVILTEAHSCSSCFLVHWFRRIRHCLFGLGIW